MQKENMRLHLWEYRKKKWINKAKIKILTITIFKQPMVNNVYVKKSYIKSNIIIYTQSMIKPKKYGL